MKRIEDDKWVTVGYPVYLRLFLNVMVILLETHLVTRNSGFSDVCAQAIQHGHHGLSMIIKFTTFILKAIDILLYIYIYIFVADAGKTK